MRACVQRVLRAHVEIEGEVVGRIDRGLVVLLGVAAADDVNHLEWMVDKIVGLRVFDDDQGKMNLGLEEVDGAVLIVSQFTLLGDCRKGRRPSFDGAADPEVAERIYHQFVAAVKRRGVRTETGRFRAAMQVSLVNDGPVTLIIDK